MQTSRVYVRDERAQFNNGPRPDIGLERTVMPDMIASFAFNIIGQWGQVASVPDGEDAAGRSKIRLASPEELVTRAFDVAELAYATASERGRLLAVPTHEEAKAQLAKKAED